MEMKGLIFNCLIICMDLKYQIVEMCNLLTRSVNCLFAQTLNEARRVVCGLSMTYLTIIPCFVVALRWRRIIMLSLLVGSFILEDIIFVWLISIIIMYIFALLECLYG